MGNGSRDRGRPLRPPRRRLGPLRPPLGPDDGRLPRALRRRPGHALLRRDARGGALALQALRLLRPRAHRARLPRHRRGDARDGPAGERALPGGEGPLRPGLRPGPVHAPRGRRRRPSWRRPTTTAPRAGSASCSGREPPAVRDRRPLRGPRARSHPPRGPPLPQLGRPRQRLHARPLHGRGGRRARLHEHRSQERVQHLPEGDLGRGPDAALGRRARCGTHASSTRATSRSAR